MAERPGLTREQAEALGLKHHKYHAAPKDADGLTRAECRLIKKRWKQCYASSKEAERHWELKQKEQQGDISDLEWQVSFRIVVNGVKVCVYIADAVYVENGRRIVEDVKSAATRTPLYKLKARLMFACHGIKVRET